jgi:intein/homing endonuclease
MCIYIPNNWKEKREEAPESSKVAEARYHPGHSFKEVIVVDSGKEKLETVTTSEQGGSLKAQKLVWEVEVETDALTKLKGAFVGFIAVIRSHMLFSGIF